MKTLHIYLFRHGQSTYNRDKRFTGWHDPSLTRLGIRQARVIAKQLKNKRFQTAFYTKLKRSQETLKEVLKYHPECGQLVEDNRMIERNYGKLNGTTHDAFIKKVGKKLYRLEVHGDMVDNLDAKGRKEIENFLGQQEYNLIHRGYYVPPPGGESFADVERRVNHFIIDLLKFMKKYKVSVAISAHGNSIRLFRKIMENASVGETQSWTIPYDKVYIYKIRVK